MIVPVTLTAAALFYLGNRHWHWIGQYEHAAQTKAPSPTPPATTSDFDPYLPFTLNKAVTVALTRESNPTNLRAFASALLPAFPGAASHLNARAATLEGPPPAPTPAPNPKAPIKSVPAHRAAMRQATRLPAVAPHSIGQSLKPGQRLTVGQSLTSPKGTTELRLQTDGNLVLYQAGKTPRPLWASGVHADGRTVVMQTDGNLVYLNAQGHPVWAAGSRSPGASLVIQDDGNMVVYAPNHHAVWSTQTQGFTDRRHHDGNLWHALGTAVHDATNIGTVAMLIPGVGQTFVPLALAAAAAAAGHTNAVKNAPIIKNVRDAATKISSTPAWKWTVGSWQQAYDQANPAHFAATLVAGTADKTLHGENFGKALKEAGDTAATYMINKAQYASMVVGVPPGAMLALKAGTVAAKAAQTGKFDARSMVDLAVSAIPGVPPAVATALDTAADIAAKKGHIDPNEIINLAAQAVPGGASAISPAVMTALKTGANIAARGGKLDANEIASLAAQAVPGMTPSELAAIKAGVNAVAPHGAPAAAHTNANALTAAVQKAASRQIPGGFDSSLVKTLTSAAAIAQGAPIAVNATQLAANVIPGGPAAKQALLSGAHLADMLVSGKQNALAAMTQAKRVLSPALQPAFDVGASLVIGRALQSRGFTEAERLVPGETVPVKVLNALRYKHAFVDAAADLRKALPSNAASLARTVATIIDGHPTLADLTSYQLAKQLKTPEPVVRAVLASTHDVVPGAPVVDTRTLYSLVGKPPAPATPQGADEWAQRYTGARNTT